MVMTIVPFNKRGRPWSDHGQFMVILWSTMVMDHDRPWSEHGRPWSDHDPAARDVKGKFVVQVVMCNQCIF